MSEQITKEQLEKLCDRVNEKSGLGAGYIQVVYQNNIAQIYSGCGGHVGYVDRGTKREVYGQLRAILDVLDLQSMFSNK